MMKKHSRALSLAVAALMLTACSGDDDPIRNAPPAPQGDTVAIIGTNLVTFNRATPGTIATSMPITGITAGETIVGGDIRPATGQYYVVTDAPAVYMVSRTTGQATNRQALTSGGMPLALDTTAGAVFGVDFNPVPDRLRITSSGNGQNLRANVDTGVTIVDGSLTLGGAPIGASEVAYSNSFGNTCRTTLFYIDTVNDQLLTTSQPNAGVVTAVGPLGVDATGATGFEIISTADAMGNITNSAIATLNVGGNAMLYNINLSTGAATLVPGSLGANPAIGLSVLPAAVGPNALGDIVAVDTSNNVVSFLAANPGKLCTSVAASGLAMGESLLDLDVRPANGLLYGLGSLGNLYTIVPTTGAAALASTLNVALDPTTGATFGIDFNPVPDRLRIVSSAGQNLRANVDTGATLVDGAINGVPNASVTAVAYTNSIAGTVTTRLFDIDTGNDQLALQQPPNDGTLVPVGSLGLMTDVTSASGFDINGLTNQAFAALNLAGASSSALYTIDLTTGAATLVGSVAGMPLSGMALSSGMTQASKATVVAVTDTGMVVNFTPATPGTTSAPVMVTGLQGGETIVGIDQRPNGRLLYAVTNANRLYTLNLTFGTPAMGQVVGPITAAAATNPVPLVPAPMDAFTMLVGNSFGTDFNPVPDRLRNTSDQNQNLRINVDTGATITDGALNGPTPPLALPPTVVASAYINNFAGTTTTTLFDIDSANGQLFMQNPPNAGTLVAVGGGLGVGMFTPTATFDVVGGDNTFALATLELVPAGNGSGLYVVNLTAGTAAPQGTPNIVGGATPLTVTAATIFLQ